LRFVFVVVEITVGILAHFDDGRGGFVDQVPNKTGHKRQSAHDSVGVGRGDGLGSQSVGNFVNVVLMLFFGNLCYKLLVTSFIEKEKKENTMIR
jgi:hypothetical protein